MIALDTNVLVRYLVADDAAQAEAARRLLAGLTDERPGFICREVVVELVWVLERTYRFSRERIAELLEELIASVELEIEARDDVARAAFRYQRRRPRFFRPHDRCRRESARRATPLYLRQASGADGREWSCWESIPAEGEWDCALREYGERGHVRVDGVLRDHSDRGGVVEKVPKRSALNFTPP